MTRRTADLVSRCHLQHAMATGGVIGVVLWLIAFAASGFLPPIPPSWDAERTVEHYRAHTRVIQAGAALMLIGGASYLCQVAAMAAQMRRIPNVPDAAHALQLGSGTLGAFCFILPGIVLAAAAYRLDRSAELTQALKDLFMFSIVLPWPPFAAQALAFAWAVLADRRPKPCSPRPWPCSTSWRPSSISRPSPRIAWRPGLWRGTAPCLSGSRPSPLAPCLPPTVSASCGPWTRRTRPKPRAAWTTVGGASRK